MTAVTEDFPDDLSLLLDQLRSDEGVKIVLPNPMVALVDDELVLTVERVRDKKAGGVVTGTVVTFEATLYGVYLCDITMKVDPAANTIIWRILD